MMQQVLEKARLALELHEVVKAMRGCRKGDAWLDTTYMKHRLRR